MRGARSLQVPAGGRFHTKCGEIFYLTLSSSLHLHRALTRLRSPPPSPPPPPQEVEKRAAGQQSKERAQQRTIELLERRLEKMAEAQGLFRVLQRSRLGKPGLQTFAVARLALCARPGPLPRAYLCTFVAFPLLYPPFFPRATLIALLSCAPAPAP